MKVHSLAFFFFLIFISSNLFSQVDYKNPLQQPLEKYPIQTIRIAVHVIQKEKGDPQNFDSTHIEYLQKLIAQLNANRQWPQPLEPNPKNITLQDVRIRFIIDTITFFKSNRYWDFGNAACNIDTLNCRNTCRAKTDSLFNEYILNNVNFSDKIKYKTLNVFLPGQNGKKKCYDGEASGIGSKKWIIMRSFYNAYKSQSEASSLWENFLLFNHELAHNFGLIHTFESQACCFEKVMPRSTTTNIMDYWPKGGASIAPCQAMQMHAQLMLYKQGIHSISEAIVPNCNHDISYRTQIANKDSVVWEKDMTIHLQTSIEVESNAILVIKGKLFMPSKTGRILLKKNCKLYIDGAKIGNACQEIWGGIYVKNKRKWKKIKIPSENGNYTFNNVNIIIKNNPEITNLD